MKILINKIIVTSVVLGVILGITGFSASAQILKQQDASARAQYQQIRQNYLGAVNDYKNAKSDFLNAQTKYQQFRTFDNKSALEDKSRKFLENAILAMINYLEAARNKAENVRGISDFERQEILAEIDKDINWLKERQGKSSTASLEQIKADAKIVRDYWLNIRAAVKRITGKIAAARINYVIAKAESFSVKVSEKINELKSAGKDTAQLELWLADFNQKIALAKEKYELAKAKFQAISNLADADKLAKEGNQFIKEANQYVLKAHAQLVRIVKEMKKMGSQVEVPAAQ